MSKVLFVYPNSEGYPMIPLGISILTGVLKENNHIVNLYDVTFKIEERLDHAAREKTGTVKKVDFKKFWGETKKTNIYEELKDKVKEFEPDLVAFSVVENNYSCAKKCFAAIKSISKVPIIVGGIFPSVEPRFFEQDKNVDIVCVGEGERAILELANRIDRKEEYKDIPNLFGNNYSEFYNWEPHTKQDWSLFEERHLWKAFVGKMWKTGCFEMSRGCPFSCSYCNNHIFQEKFKCLGNYHREKPLLYIIDEIQAMKEKYNLELIFFNDENFLMMGKKRFNDFCKLYGEKIKLPFFMQTKAELLCNEEKVKKLKEINCAGIGIGIETGNEKIRAQLLNKETKNEVYKKAIKITNKYDIRTTGYVMLGLPFETEKNIIETAEFLKEIEVSSVGLAIFAPYYGTKLYDICVENGFINGGFHENISVNYHSILKQPQLSNEKLEELYYNFNKMVYGDSDGR